MGLSRRVPGTLVIPIFTSQVQSTLGVVRRQQYFVWFGKILDKQCQVDALLQVPARSDCLSGRYPGVPCLVVYSVPCTAFPSAEKEGVIMLSAGWIRFGILKFIGFALKGLLVNVIWRTSLCVGLPGQMFHGSGV